MGPPPNLLTIDWHDDVGGDCDFTPGELASLDPTDENELALFCWAGLRSLNDGHIAPAQYLDAVGDVYVILKQGVDEGGSVSVQKDRHGKAHRVYYYDTPEQFLAAHGGDAQHPVIFDLDLDYFTAADEAGVRGGETLVSDSEIRATVAPDGPLMRWVFPRLAGFTIALEPEYCGGIGNCMRALNVVSGTLFDPPLLRAGMRWRRRRGSRRGPAL